MLRKFMGIVLVIAICLCSVLPCFAQTETPTYIIGAEQADGTVTVTLSIENASATIGRFALAYDTEKVELLDKNGETLTTDTPRTTEVVANESCITIFEQANLQGVSLTDGFVLLEWYASGTRVDASAAPQAIARYTFALKDGVTEEDFDSATFRMKTITPGTYPDWRSGAHIATGSYDHFWNNVDGFGQCAVVKDYINCDVLPIITYAASFTVKDGEGAAVADADIRVNETDYKTDASGRLSAELPVGDYGYTVSKNAHETKSGLISVLDRDVSEAVVIRTDMQYVTEEIQKVEIVYVEGNSAVAVTASVGLPLSDIGGAELSWKSSNTGVIADTGAVIRPRTDTTVTLTLTFTKGEASATREFVLTVLNKSESAPGPVGGTTPGGTDNTDTPSGGDGDNADVGTGDDTAEPKDPPAVDVKAPEFKDLHKHLWAEEAIITLAKDGVIKGTSETTFSPADAIKRGDFVTLLVRMFDFEAADTENFTDVPADSYYYREIAIAKALGIAKGVDSEHFQPEASISRQDMMVIVLRAIELYGLPLQEAEGDVLDSFTDKDSIDSYAVEAVRRLVGAKLIAGNENGTINPLGMTTRAEVAVFLYRIYGIV